MIEYEIHQYLHSLLVRLVEKFAVIVKRTETGIDREIVHDVVSVIGIGLLEGRQPKRIDA